jgi:hypothetical protein
MSLTASNDRILRVHRELGKILDDLSVTARLPQALLDRFGAIRRTLLEELNASAAEDANGNSLSTVPLCGGSEVYEHRTIAPLLTTPDSKHQEENALLRMDDDGGADCTPLRIAM